MMTEKKSYYNDVLGNALLDYLAEEPTEDIQVYSDISEEDIISLDYLFRTEESMPDIEIKALSLCKGKVLDVGAASGCHSFALKNKGVEVEAIDISEGAVEVMLKQGLENVSCVDFYDLSDKKYDTILLLMNGIGIAQNVVNLPRFFTQLKKCLLPEGQVILDSSDIKYMFEEEDGSMWVDVSKNYYGEVTYQMKYKQLTTEKFDWLFMDFETLKKNANANGFVAEKVFEGENHHFLTRLTTVNNS